MKNIILAVSTLSGLGLIFAVVLSWASKKFQVNIDPRVIKIAELLPGANCGACGFAGCYNFAEALMEKQTELSYCVACSKENKKEIISLLGLSEPAQARSTKIAVIGCGGGMRSNNKFHYAGLADCRIAALTLGGQKECLYGCLDQGTCISACPFAAIRRSAEGEIKVVSELCRGCGKCLTVCPRKIIYMLDSQKKVYVRCRSLEKGSQVMKKCKVGCIACAKCVKVCPVNAIAIENDLAVIDYSKCVNCGKCVKTCPTKVITFHEEI